MNERLNLPSPNAEPERYAGRPLLLILENYILDVLGELGPEKRQSMGDVVRRVFGGGQDWKATIRRQLQLDHSIDADLAAMWKKNKEIAATNGVELLPVQFAKMIVDTNFADKLSAS
jgi:hypothetical protein